MTMPIEIVDYVSSDYEAVWELHQRTVLDNAGFVKNLSFHADIHDILNIYKVFFLAKAGEKIVGMVGLKQIDQEALEIKRLQIASSHQGCGIAKALMKRVFDYAYNEGIAFLRLDVSEPQVKAFNLYTAYGFQVMYIKERFLGPDNERFLSTYMEKRL